MLIAALNNLRKNVRRWSFEGARLSSRALHRFQRLTGTAGKPCPFKTPIAEAKVFRKLLHQKPGFFAVLSGKQRGLWGG
jgi:hypothetical protein